MMSKWINGNEYIAYDEYRVATDAQPAGEKYLDLP
jgi:hypothetical protein